jgi:hypothetical protein
MYWTARLHWTYRMRSVSVPTAGWYRKPALCGRRKGVEIHRDVSSSQESSVKRSAYASVLMCGSLISSMIRAMSWSGFSKPDGKIALASWVACAASGSWSGKIPTQVTSAVRVPNGVARDGQSRGAEKA